MTVLIFTYKILNHSNKSIKFSLKLEYFSFCFTKISSWISPLIFAKEYLIPLIVYIPKLNGITFTVTITGVLGISLNSFWDIPYIFID